MKKVKIQFSSSGNIYEGHSNQGEQYVFLGLDGILSKTILLELEKNNDVKILEWKSN